MIDIETLKVGDKIVNFGKVHEIFEISLEKQGNESRKIVYFRPFFTNPQNKGLTCSIPLQNVTKAEIRRPITKQVTRELHIEIKQEIKTTTFPDANEITTMFNTNDPQTMVKILRLLNKEKKIKETGLSTSKKNIYDKIIDSLAQEFAFATNKPVETAKKKIESALK